jgi:hypothetical protein
MEEDMMLQEQEGNLELMTPELLDPTAELDQDQMLDDIKRKVKVRTVQAVSTPHSRHYSAPHSTHSRSRHCRNRCRKETRQTQQSHDSASFIKSHNQNPNISERKIRGIRKLGVLSTQTQAHIWCRFGVLKPLVRAQYVSWNCCVRSVSFDFDCEIL